MFKYTAIFMIFLLSSCAIREEYQKEEIISDNSVKEALNLNSKNESINKEWYKIFNDEDLNTLLFSAYKTNLDIKQNIEKLKQARYSYLINSKEYFPMIDGGGIYSYSKTNGKSSPLSVDTNDFKAGFDVSWEIDIWGKGKALSKQYMELVNSAKFSLFDTHVLITFEVINNYTNLRLNQEKLRIAKNNQKLQEDILDIVTSKYNNGVADELALSQAKHSLELVKSSIPEIKTNINKYKNALHLLLGVEPKNLPINLDKFSKNITAKTFKYNVQHLYNIRLDTIRTRPDIRMAEAEILSQNEVVNQAIIDLYPTLNLGASLGFISSSLGDLFNTEVLGYTPQIMTPIWHWGKLKNNIELQKHIKEEYIITYNKAMLSALLDLKNSIYLIEESYKANTSYKKALDDMRNIFYITLDKYKNGLIEFSDLANAEQDYLSAQNTFVQSNANILQGIALFYKATGGGYNFCD